MTKEQLKVLLRQVLNDVDVNGQVTASVREEIARLQAEGHNNPESYAARVLNGRARRRVGVSERRA